MKSQADETLKEANIIPRFRKLKRVAVWTGAVCVAGYFWLGFEIPFTGYRYCAGVPGYFLHRVELSRRMEDLSLRLIKRHEKVPRYQVLYDDIVEAFLLHRECVRTASLEDCSQIRLPNTNELVMFTEFRPGAWGTMWVKIGLSAELNYTYGIPGCNFDPSSRSARAENVNIVWGQGAEAAIP
jgi:hypothetical protein